MATTPQPFVTFITRTFGGRPGMMAQNAAAIQAQDDPDWEQIILLDEERRGVAYGDLMIGMPDNLAKIAGQWVFVVDDDNKLSTPRFVSTLKAIAKKHNPDVIMFKSRYADLGILPRGDDWNASPQHGRTSPFSCLIKADIFKQFAHIWAEGGAYVGDYLFLKAIVDSGAKLYWHDGEVMAEVQSRSNGRAE